MIGTEELTRRVATSMTRSCDQELDPRPLALVITMICDIISCFAHPKNVYLTCSWVCLALYTVGFSAHRQLGARQSNRASSCFFWIHRVSITVFDHCVYQKLRWTHGGPRRSTKASSSTASTEDYVIIITYCTHTMPLKIQVSQLPRCC